jgi:hypothetical protein
MRFGKAQRSMFLEHVRAGMPVGRAADALRLDRIAVREYISDNADFRELVEHAQIDATEAIEEALYLAGASGHVNAGLKWLELTGRQIRPGSQQSPAPEPEADPLADPVTGEVVPLDPRRRKST